MSNYLYICLYLSIYMYNLYLLSFIPALPLGGEVDTLGTGDIDQEEEKDDTPIFEKHDNLLHGRSRG